MLAAFSGDSGELQQLITYVCRKTPVIHRSYTTFYRAYRKIWCYSRDKEKVASLKLTKVYGQKHMKLKFSHLAVTGLLCMSAGNGAFAFAQGGDLSLLESLERGMWQLRAVGGGPSGAAATQICLGDPVRLAQIQHGATACEQYVVRSTPNAVTVSYSCKGQGQGLTTIRKESGKLIHIQSQGIRNNSPFSFSVEGRKTGAC